MISAGCEWRVIRSLLSVWQAQRHMFLSSLLLSCGTRGGTLLLDGASFDGLP